LFRIVPQISSEADPATLELAVRRSQSNHELALQELKRLEKLLSQDAIPERRVSAALKEEEVARAELEAAKRRLKQYRSNPKEKFEATAVLVTSPIDGVLDGIYLNPGAYLQEGTPLFHVVDTTRLRLEARIVEADIGRLVQPHGAWFEVDGFETAFEINLANGGRLITLGLVVDPQTRTVPLVFEFSNPKDQLRIGMFARIHVLTGKPKKALAIPLTAVQENAGQTSTYIQTGDQNFEHRVLRLGLRDGQFIEVISGLTKGDRVVTQGSYLIQLAASGTQEIGHGHAH
jgi:RND family efflux transporter MFP subunit